MNLRPADQSLAAVWPLIEEDIARIQIGPPTVSSYIPVIPQPRNRTVARMVQLKPGESTTVFAAEWPKNLLKQARTHGCVCSARRLHDNAWCVERVR